VNFLKYEGLSGINIVFKMKRLLQSHQLIVTVLFMLSAQLPLTTNAQVLQPVSGTFTIQPPYSVYLSNFFIPGSERMQLAAVFNDFNETSVDVKLRVTIEGSGLTLRTKPNFNGATFTLYPGANAVDPQILEQYFSFNNLDASGISKQELIRSGALPEGFYTFKIEFLEINSGRLISNTAIGSALLVKNMPPLLTMPSDQSSVPVIEPQNILFQWQAVSDATINTAYELTLVQVPEGINPNDAVNGTGTPILDAKTVYGTVYNYGAVDEQLIMGMNYAWRVKAYDQNNQAIFENEGQSQVFSFTYGYPLNGNIPLALPADSSTKQKSNMYFQWQGPSNAIAGTPLVYQLSLVEVNQNQTPRQAMLNNVEVLTEETPALYSTSGYSHSLMNDLESGKKYAWQVKALVSDIEVAESPIYSFSTPPDIDRIFIKGHELLVKEITNPNPSHLAGKGEIQIASNGNKISVDFSALNISRVAGRWVLNSGEVRRNWNKVHSVEIPNSNDTAKFLTQELKLNNNGLMLKGKLAYPTPFKTLPRNIESEIAWINFDNYRITGTLTIPDESKFSILELTDFELSLNKPSKITLTNSNSQAYFNGHFKLPQTIASPINEAVYLTFSNHSSLDAFDESNSSFTEEIAVVNLDGLSIVPTKYTLDYDSLTSPGSMSNNASWNGLYISEYDLMHDFEQSHESGLQINRKATQHNSLEEFVSIDQLGLNLSIDHDYSSIGETQYANFKNLSGELSRIILTVSDNEVQDSRINGFSYAASIGDYNFDYTIPLSGDSMAYAYYHLNKISGSGFPLYLEPQSLAFGSEASLSGESWFLVSESDTVSADFQGIKLKADGDSLVIDDGNATTELSNFSINKQNGNEPYDLKPTSAKVDREGMHVFLSEERWTLPLATTQGAAIVDFKDRWVNYSDYKVVDTLFVENNPTFELLDPNGFDVKLSAESYLLIKEQSSEFNYSGSIVLPKFGEQTAPIEVPFSEKDALLTIHHSFSQVSSIQLISHVGIAVKPQKVIIDFDENTSPGLLDSAAFWKGAYFTEFENIIKTQIDGSSDYTLNSELVDAVKDESNNKFYLDNGGVTYHVVNQYSHSSIEDDYLDYHGFKGELTFYALSIVEESFKGGNIGGELLLPLASTSKKISFSTGIDANKVNIASLNTTDFHDLNRTFNSGGLEEVQINFKSAQFATSGDVNFTVDLDFPAYRLSFQDLDQLYYKSSGDVAFNNWSSKSKTLQNQINGDLGKVFPFTANKIKAHKIKEGVYGFKVEGEVVIADNFAGSNGAIKGDFTAPFTDKLSNNQLENYAESNSSLTKFGISTPVEIKTGPVQFRAGFVYTHGDPEYGNSVQTYASASLKVPIRFNALVKVIVGEKDGTKYWFAQAAAGLASNFPKDSALRKRQAEAAAAAAAQQRTVPARPTPNPNPSPNPNNNNSEAKKFKGVPIGPVLLTAFEGRIYHHMSHKEGGGTNDVDYVPDPMVDFGIYAAVTMIDAVSEGGAFKVKGAIEATFSPAGLNTLAIAAEVGLGNKQTTETSIGKKGMSESAIGVSGDLKLNVPERRFTAQLSANIEKGFCVSGTVFIDVSPTVFDLKLGTKDDKITVIPQCPGFGGLGYLHVNTQEIELAVGVVARADFKSGIIKIPPVIQVRPYAEVGIDGGVLANVQYRPKLLFKKAGLWVNAYARVYVVVYSPVFEGTLSVANVNLSGNLDMHFEPEVKLEGGINGNVSVLEGLAKFNFTLPVNHKL